MRHQIHVQRFAASARAEHCDVPQVFTFADNVDHFGVETIRQLLNTHGH
jgi:hypothetical protein